MKKINIGVIGCGHWGPNHIRNTSTYKKSRVLYCADLDAKRLNFVKEINPQIELLTDYHKILEDKNIDGVIVATPTNTHYKIVKDCLEAGKHVLCEKPLTTKHSDAEELVNLAETRKKILVVGHVFLFNAGVQTLRDYVQTGLLGKIMYINSVRTNLGPIRSDVNVVLDLASHDISIFSYLFETKPLNVIAKGESFYKQKIEDVAFITLTYPNKIIANIQVSWLDPQKIRQLTIVGDKKMVVWNDLNNVEPIKLYDKGVIEEPYYNDYGEFQLLLRENDVLIPKINLVEPLKAQDTYFIDCIEKNTEPDIASSRLGSEVVGIIEAINQSMKVGKVISL